MASKTHRGKGSRKRKLKGVPCAEVDKPHSNEETGVMFWQNDSSPAGLVQYGSHVTKFTPNYCKRHRRAHDARACPLCSAARTKVKKKS